MGKSTSANGKPKVIEWVPLKNRAKRTVAKPYTEGGRVTAWLHHASYIKCVFLASRPFIQVTPTRLLTEDGRRVKGGPDVGRIVIKWLGQERNLHVLYNVRFWTSILRRGPGPTISIRTGDQWTEVGVVPAFVQQTYGVQGDQLNLMDRLDTEAPMIADLEDQSIAVSTLPEDVEELDISDEAIENGETEDEEA